MKKYSRKREAILAVIAESTAHPTAESVYSALKPRFPDLSLGTVYRNIAVFKNEGDIRSVGVVNGQERLDGNTSLHPHFICEKCGTVADIWSIDNNCKLEELVALELKCQVNHHSLAFWGICESCLKCDYPEEKN